jgi:hypothetical protein
LAHVTRLRGNALVGLVVLSLVAAGGCQERERSNPFDPGNPDTRGEPALLVALAGDGEVRVSWDLADLRGVAAIRVLRSAGPGGDRIPVFQAAGPGPGLYTDRGLTDGTTYSYRLEVRSDRGSLLWTAPDPATPGKSEPWVGDSNYGIARLSPDGRHELFRQDRQRNILGLQVASDATVWAADYAGGAVVRYGRHGQVLEEREIDGASALALDVRDGRLWVGSFNRHWVGLYRRDGSMAWADSNMGLVQDVAAAPDSGVFVAAGLTGVTRLVEGAVLWQNRDFVSAVAVVPQADGSCWVVDRAGAAMVHLGAEGQRDEDSYSAIDPTGACSDGEDGIYLADPGFGGIIHLDSTARVNRYFALGPAESVTLDPIGGRLWIVFPSQGRVAVLEGIDLSGQGSLSRVSSVALAGRPTRIAGYWGRPLDVQGRRPSMGD